MAFQRPVYPRNIRGSCLSWVNDIGRSPHIRRNSVLADIILRVGQHEFSRWPTLGNVLESQVFLVMRDSVAERRLFDPGHRRQPPGLAGPTLLNRLQHYPAKITRRPAAHNLGDNRLRRRRQCPSRVAGRTRVRPAPTAPAGGILRQNRLSLAIPAGSMPRLNPVFLASGAYARHPIRRQFASIANICRPPRLRRRRARTARTATRNPR